MGLEELRGNGGIAISYHWVGAGAHSFSAQARLTIMILFPLASCCSTQVWLLYVFVLATCLLYVQHLR